VIKALQQTLRAPGLVRYRASDRLARANDASHYHLVPQAVVVPHDHQDVARLLRTSAEQGIRLTLRSGGTSLSGQSVTDGVLVDVRSRFRRIEVLDGGARVRVQPGATLRAVNTMLAPYGRRLGPDPASEAACTIGGVIANNSSGMACGITENAYRTLRSVTVVLPSGTVLDTGSPDADRRLRELEPRIFEGLSRLRRRIVERPESVRAIRAQFAIKNTMGYALNAFLDYAKPADLLAHLIVGSEGTLAFTAEAVLDTVPLRPLRATGLLVFHDVPSATTAVPEVLATGAAVIELLDTASLRVGQRNRLADAWLADLDLGGHAALLVEYQHSELERHTAATAEATAALARLGMALTSDQTLRDDLWHLRKGLYAAVAGARPSGTLAILEDIAVPVDALGQTCADLTDLFDRYGYGDAVVFGHARDGNLHFMLTDRFDGGSSLERYRAFTDDMVDLILHRGGSLKAEHGTGRTMAPFLRRQYGDELFDVMREIKDLFDPRGLLGPGVIVTDDPQAHLRDLKTVLATDPEIDRCVECGYCEPVCPSRALTTTPRQRIVLRRAIAAARADGDTALAEELAAEFEYDGIQTCAVDGMCETACPVGINTGDLIKRLRADGTGRTAARVWTSAARHWSTASGAARLALSAARAVPPVDAQGFSALARAVGGSEHIPQWTPDLPGGGRRRSRLPSQERPDIVYFPSCPSAIFAAHSGSGVGDAFVRLCQRAGVRVSIPDAVDGLCCGMPWKSKGYTGGYDVMRRRVAAAVHATGAAPIVVDAASCTEGLIDMLATTVPGVTVVDAVSYTLSTLAPKLTVPAKLQRLVLHPTCSTTRLAITADLAALAGHIAETVIVPSAWTCCGFAGDRGLLHPELTESATRDEAIEVDTMDGDAYASCNRTCEIGLRRATGRPYRHIVELVEELTR
jgi:D-lactate dehydrogenase